MKPIRALIAVLMLIGAPALPDNSTDTTASVPLPELLYVPGGSFFLGDTTGSGSANERPARRVSLTPFYLARTEVTFASYDRFCDATGCPRPSDNGWGRGDHPVINVSWLDAVAYCNWLSERAGLEAFYHVSTDGAQEDWSSTGYRLPTEAEWEYAALGRALEGLPASGPPKGWVQGTSGGRTHPVATGAPGPLGLHDMLGNVWEWCNDRYDTYPEMPQADPRGPATGQHRVLRGGSWYDALINVRVTARSWHLPTRRLPMAGFRVARSALTPPDGVGG